MPFYEIDDFTPDTSPGYLTKRIFQLSSQRLEPVFAAEGTTHLQWSALVSIWFGGGITCAELARVIAHDAGATSRLLDTLEDKGLVERCRNREDRRVVNLTLTADGLALAQRCRASVTACWNAWLADWDEADSGALIRLLRRLRDTLETMEAACA